MSDRKKIYVTNMPNGILGTLTIIFLVVLFVHGCTDACKGLETTVQCGGYLAKELKKDFEKGYAHEAKKE